MSASIELLQGAEPSHAQLYDEHYLDILERIEYIKTASEIARIKLVDTKPLRKDGEIIGYLETYDFTTNAGYGYDAITAIPLQPRTGVPLLGTSAWFTSGSNGHNQHLVRHFCRDLEDPVIFVGQEGGNHKPGLVTAKTNISLAGSAGATLAFSQFVAQTHPEAIDTTRRILIGESRGAMVAMGILALDKTFGQVVVFADLTAPCFPRRPGFLDFLRLSGHLISEPQSVKNMLPKFALKQLIHLPSTIDMNVIAKSHEAAIGVTLFSGEAGGIARLIDPNKIIHITLFDNDYASMRGEWKNIFANYPNVRITLLPGSHLSLADPETLAFIEARNKSYHKLSSVGVTDGQAIFDHAHELLAS